MMKKTTILGTFECTSGKLQITDPGAHAASIYHDAQNGIWEVKAVYTDDGKVFAVTATHTSMTEADLENMDCGEFTDPVQVVDGIIGIFDYASFYNTITKSRCELWQVLKERAKTPNFGGMVECGAVVTPGGGNSDYAVACVMDKDEKMVQISIDFLSDLQTVVFGTFECTGNKLMISDPGYSVGTWCQGVLDNVVPGTWKAGAVISDEKMMGKRVGTLYVTHSSMTEEDIEKLPVTKADFVVGVDSGQAGIFDSQHYRDDSVVTEPVVGGLFDTIHIQPTGDAGEKWYDLCCSKTLQRINFGGVIPYGVVSTSGFGDGAYTCYYRANAEGQVVHLMIEFLDDKHRHLMKQLLSRR